MARGSVYFYLLLLGLVKLPLCATKSITQVYAFGDHLLDVGATNYFKNAIIKANFGPYSQSFKPRSGRFSNGQLTIDYISECAGKWLLTKVSRAPSLTCDNREQQSSPRQHVHDAPSVLRRRLSSHLRNVY